MSGTPRLKNPGIGQQRANPGNWHEQAACKNRTDEMALPLRAVGRGGSAKDRIHATNAKLICKGCPVLEQCKAWALTMPDPGDGMVCGGMTPDDRKVARGVGRRRAG